MKITNIIYSINREDIYSNMEYILENVNEDGYDVNEENVWDLFDINNPQEVASILGLPSELEVDEDTVKKYRKLIKEDAAEAMSTLTDYITGETNFLVWDYDVIDDKDVA